VQFPAQDTSYYYTGKQYGSEGLFNPLYFLLNCGYDNFQVMSNRSLIHQDYRPGFDNVWRNLKDPFSAIRTSGTKDFLTTEVFPTSLAKKHAQWVPNYKLHLIGGGMSYREMAEWYAYHNVPLPKTMSFFTMATAWFINESLENGTLKGVNVDPIADMYIFNLGGVLLFSFDNINRFFSEDLHLSDWSLQPSINYATGEMFDNGEYYHFAWKIPWWKHWYIFEVFGYNGVFGAGYKWDSGHTLSVGYGLNVSTVEMFNLVSHKKTVRVVDCIGVYYDLNGSLMSSLVYSETTNNKFVLNVYPGVISFKDFSPGFWLVLNTGRHAMGGITFRYFPGLAVN
jgi:hypothetical protein